MRQIVSKKRIKHVKKSAPKKSKKIKIGTSKLEEKFASEFLNVLGVK